MPNPARRASVVHALRTALVALKRKMVELLDWRPQLVQVPRSACHWVTLDVAGVPRRQLGESIRLQLMHLTGLEKIGFAWRAIDSTAEIWYWDERQFADRMAEHPQVLTPTGVTPCPESLLRAPMESGLWLVACAEGFEALALERGRICKTRWFGAAPDANGWRSFVRDAGENPDIPMPPHVSPSMLTALPAQTGWRIQTTLSQRISRAFLAGLSLATVVGAVFLSMLAYDAKLNWEIFSVRSDYERLATDNAEVLKLSNQLNDHAAFFAALGSARAPVSQLALMDQLARTGIFGGDTKISLIEWEYRNGRLRLLFAVPPDNFSLSLFLSTLENQGGLKEMRLMPDTPPATVGVQAVVANEQRAATP